MNAKTKSKVNTAFSRNSKKNRDRSRNVDSTHDKPRKRAGRGSKRTSMEIEQTATAVVSAKRSRMQSSANQRHHDADELNSIENSFSLSSSEEEASIHGTDDDDDISSKDSDGRKAAAWEEGSADIGCNTGNNRAPSSFLRTAFSDALDREKENAVKQIVESSPSNAAGRAISQRKHNGDASSNTAMGIRPPPSHTPMEALFSNENPGRRHGGRLEASVMDLDDVQAGLHGLTQRIDGKRQPHVADRVRHYVKSIIFRRIKFVNSNQMSHRALQLVMDHDNVPARNREKFYMLYDSVLKEALNTKRSLCEQTAGRIVREGIAQLENPGDFFTMEELCKLRRATTEWERDAFFWFFGTFMDRVSGRRSWGKQKFKQLVLTASEQGGQSKACHKER
jgi:hypothetical protein